MKRTVIVAVLVLASAAFAGELAQMHKQMYGQDQGGQTPTEVKKGYDSHGITKIGLERTACYGSCPIYTVIIRNDGTILYHGEKFVDRVGRYTGMVPKQEFDKLAAFIKDVGFADLDPEYATAATDHPAAYTMVSMGGEQKVVKNYGNAGPTKLWAIEQLIDKLLLETKWNEAAKAVGPGE